MIDDTTGERWDPIGTTVKRRPDVGDLLAARHAVWKVHAVQATPREVWTEYDEQRMHHVVASHYEQCRPYEVEVSLVAGERPDFLRGKRDDTRSGFRVPAGSGKDWHVYPHGRWAACSCCGQPMPCRSELADRAVDKATAEIETLTAKIPGACWSCNEPISTRQRSVIYPGENVELPGAPPPRFHVRAVCHHAATKYELKWLAADPRRQRILTWPDCPGVLVVHADGKSECIPTAGVGRHPECAGHLTHNHRHRRTCAETCGRGCDQDTHPGIAARQPRPLVRTDLPLPGWPSC